MWIPYRFDGLNCPVDSTNRTALLILRMTYFFVWFRRLQARRCWRDRVTGSLSAPGFREWRPIKSSTLQLPKGEALHSFFKCIRRRLWLHFLSTQIRMVVIYLVCRIECEEKVPFGDSKLALCWLYIWSDNQHTCVALRRVESRSRLLWQVQ